jgi:hypothetical protein
MIKLARYSLGVGDRFGHQGRAQLRALQAARDAGVTVVPVWNKSFREHGITGTTPAHTRAAAAAAVAAEDWRGGYHVDADHIGLKNVEGFIAHSDFFTLDVADFIGRPAPDTEIEAFAARQAGLTGTLEIEGLEQPLTLTAAGLESIARHYLAAIQAAGAIYRHIAERRGAGTFITEVSLDETAAPQSPVELLVLLAGLAEQEVPLQTLAPKFTGAFHKGVDYVGDPASFAREFAQDICVLRHAVARFNLPANLKLSVHSGSDKFSLYRPIAAALRRHDAGLHLKTAGTTWLEEVVGLAAAGGGGLRMAQTIYSQARPRFDELCAPYATVVAIDQSRLPEPRAVDRWQSEQFARALRHEPADPLFNADFRQFMHVSFRIAAELGARYIDALEEHAGTIGRHVTDTLLERHLRPLFLNDRS